MTAQNDLMDRIGDAVEAARRGVRKEADAARKKARDVKLTVERDVKRKVKTVATRVKKAATKVEKAVTPKKPAARKAATPGMKLDKGIAALKRATKKAETAVRETVTPASKAAKKKPAKRATSRTSK